MLSKANICLVQQNQKPFGYKSSGKAGFLSYAEVQAFSKIFGELHH